MTCSRDGSCAPDSFLAGDCIAICTPRAVVSVVLLVERIVLFPKEEPATQQDIGPRTEEIYDFLIRPEDEAISRVLLVSPHALFDPEDPAASFEKQVKCCPLVSAEIKNWHYADPPRYDGNEVVAGIHSFNSTSPLTPGPIEYKRGTFHAAHASLPEELLGEQAMSALWGLGRTVFQCKFDVPIKPGEQRWLRVKLTPEALSSPCQMDITQDNFPGASRLNVSQTLDILGADTMLGSFKDNLDMPRSPQLRKSITKELTDDDILGLQQVKDFAFENGFLSEGTYTRIEDQRILLVPRGCRIDTKFFEGSVSFQGLAPIETEWGKAIAYRWSSGLNEYSRHDPVAVAGSVAGHLKEFAPGPALAKSKPDIAVATSAEYKLCCAVVDQFLAEGYVGREGVDLYYWASRDLPKDDNKKERWRTLVKITKPIASSMVLIKAHFRIFYSMQWSQVPSDILARNLLESRRISRFRAIAVTALIVGVLSLIMGIARLFLRL
jgi:hypothetical protein